MMRSLWTAASGMRTQQLMVDTISNNLSNANTVGYKKERLEFKSLLYETMVTAGDTSIGEQPVNLQVGHGVMAVGTVKNFAQGNLERTEAPLDFAISGSGFFAMENLQGELEFSKNGAFKLSLLNNKLILTTSGGDRVLNTDGEAVALNSNTLPEKLFVDESGKLSYIQGGETVELNQQLQIVQFKNSAGLKALGGGMFTTTIASGEPLMEVENDELIHSKVAQGTLESSNVQAVEEMVKLIIAQRAYELSSKAIQSSDEMLSQANNLKR